MTSTSKVTVLGPTTTSAAVAALVLVRVLLDPVLVVLVAQSNVRRKNVDVAPACDVVLRSVDDTSCGATVCCGQQSTDNGTESVEVRRDEMMIATEQTTRRKERKGKKLRKERKESAVNQRMGAQTGDVRTTGSRVVEQ